MLDNLFIHILDMTATGSIVIAVVLLTRLVLKRMPKIFSYCLWAVVLLRLLCPVSISMPIHMVPTVTAVSDSYSLADESIPITALGEATWNAIEREVNGSVGMDAIYVGQIREDNTYRVVKIYWWEGLVMLGQYVWIGGIVVMSAMSLIRLLRLNKRLREAVHLQERIFLADGIATPFVMGLIRPRIYLSSDLTEQEQHYVLLHEQHHIRRLDHVWKALGFAALCLHWFNPLVWVAFTLAGRDMEMSCDEAVIKKLGINVRADYSQSLLRFTIGRATIAGAPLAFGEGDAGQRIRNISRWKKPVRWLSAIAGVLCVALIVGCAVSQQPTYRGTDAEMIFDCAAEAFSLQQKFSFKMEEFPGVVFQCDGVQVFATENGKTRPVLSGIPLNSLYLADLNGDGKREFCADASFGSGLIDHRILVCDFADDMYYCLEERWDFDYYLRLDNEKLVVSRTRWCSSVAQMLGDIVLTDRKLTFVSGATEIPGASVSPKFREETLPRIIQTARKHIADDGWCMLQKTPAVEYYLSLHRDDFADAIREENGFRRIYYGQAQATEEEKCYLAVLELFSENRGYWYGLDQYICQDPNDPAQLILCTEIRDSGYRWVEEYYAAVTQGLCSAHAETFVIRLDSHAIYRYGSSENLYEKYCT